MHLTVQTVHVFPCSSSATKGNNGTNWILYHNIGTETITESPVFHCWNQAFWIVGFLGCSPNKNSSWCREQHEGQLIWAHYTRFQLSNIQILWSWHHRWRIWVSFSVINGLAIEVLLWMLDLWSSHQTDFVETGSSRWIVSSAVTCAAVALWFWKQSFSMYNNLFPSMSIFTHCSSSLMLSSHNSYTPM
jgi:hypothetical protein